MDIFVGNLDFNVTEAELKELFTSYGEVESLNIIKDKYTGNSRGFGFVKMPSNEDAQKAIDGLDGNTINNKSIKVNKSQPRGNQERKNFRKPRGHKGGKNQKYW